MNTYIVLIQHPEGHHPDNGWAAEPMMHEAVLKADYEQAIRERDEMRQAAPDADAAYWQDRCLDHATALDSTRAERDRLREENESLRAGRDKLYDQRNARRAEADRLREALSDVADWMDHPEGDGGLRMIEVRLRVANALNQEQR